MTALSQVLRGVIGLVDVSRDDWRETLERNRHLLSGVAIPGAAEQTWLPAFRIETVEQLVAAGRPTPVLAGSAGVWPDSDEYINDTLEYINQTVERTRLASAAGATFALVPTPIGLRPLTGQMPQALIYRYFRDVQAKASIPVVIYQPRGTPEGWKLEPESILSLVRLGRIVGLIVEDGAESDISESVRAGRRADFTVICGAELLPEALEWGATGVAIRIDDPALASVASLVRSGTQ